MELRRSCHVCALKILPRVRTAVEWCVKILMLWISFAPTSSDICGTSRKARERESQSCKPWTWWPMANHDHPNSMILHDHHDHGLFMLYPLAPRSIGVPFHRSAMAFVFLSPWQPWGPMAAPAWPSSPSRPRPAVFATPPAALGLGLGPCLAGAGAMRKRGTQMRAEPKQKSRFRPFFRFFKGGNER